MEEARKKVLFVGWFRTLCDDRFWNVLSAEEFTQLEKAFRKLNPTMPYVWEVGGHTSEEVCRRLSTVCDLTEQRLFDSLVEGCKKMRVNVQCAALLKRLRAHYHAVLVTDSMDCFTRFTVEAAGLTELFDEIVNSADVGRAICDDNLQLLRDLAAKRGLQLSDCVLIDYPLLNYGAFEDAEGIAYKAESAQHASTLLAGLLAQTWPKQQGD